MNLVEILNYLAEKYNFEADDLSLIDEIIDQIVNNEDYEYDAEDKEDYDADDKYEDEEYDYTEER